MTPTIFVDPPHLAPWLSTDALLNSVLLLDVQFDFLDGSIFRTDINAIFNSIPVKRGVIQQADYYVGASGGEVSYSAYSGTIKNHTQQVDMEVNYKSEVNRTRSAKLCISPEKSEKTQTRESTTKFGSISFEENVVRNYTTQFSNSERLLSVRNFGGGMINWMLSSPRGEKAVSDFLVGNLHLFAEAEFGRAEIKGSISVRPSNVFFYDNDKRRLSTHESLLMWFVLFGKGVKVRFTDGFSINFRVAYA